MPKPDMSSRRYSHGFSLIEVVIFIVVVGIGLAVLTVLHTNTARGSVDPLIRKQALALATSLIEEIQLRGFTYCDPDDANVYTASSSGGCATAPGEALGVEAGETHNNRSTLDNVNDYYSSPDLTMTGAGIKDIRGNSISATDLNGYTLSVNIANIDAGELPLVSDPNDALRITVTASGPTGVSVTLKAYRLRYAPNSP